MRQIETDWWTMDLPPEWQAQQDEATVVVADSDEVGEISLTTLQPEAGEATAEDLDRLIADADLSVAEGEPVSVGDFDGRYYELEEEGEFIREWYLTGGGLLLLVSYCCDVDNREMDREAVDQILDTLTVPGAESRG